jgi:septal ring factor EnvC (AmiA/AmiB activator)
MDAFAPDLLFLEGERAEMTDHTSWSENREQDTPIERLEAKLAARDSLLDKYNADNERLVAEIEALRAENARLIARAKRLEGILTGKDKQETADKIFAATDGRMNTRSVWILADELVSAHAKEVKHD